MSVLICKNTSTEGPGTIEDSLHLQGIPYTIVDLFKGESLPDATSVDMLVILGGPMSVNDDIPDIRKEDELVRDVASIGKKKLGVLLGAQIMAKAFCLKVHKGSAPEDGWLDITLREEGLRESLMLSMAGDAGTGESWKRYKFFHWHGETFDIPKGATRRLFRSLSQPGIHVWEGICFPVPY